MNLLTLVPVSLQLWTQLGLVLSQLPTQQPLPCLPPHSVHNSSVVLTNHWILNILIKHNRNIFLKSAQKPHLNEFPKLEECKLTGSIMKGYSNSSHQTIHPIAPASPYLKYRKGNNIISTAPLNFNQFNFPSSFLSLFSSFSLPEVSGKWLFD